MDPLPTTPRFFYDTGIEIGGEIVVREIKSQRNRGNRGQACNIAIHVLTGDNSVV